MTITDEPAAPQAGARWQERANCVNTDPEAFFPAKSESTAAAKHICANCAVRAECLRYAMENHERFGVWGGHSERERRRLQRGEAVSPSMNHGGHRPSAACWQRGCRLADCRWAAHKAGLIP